jgi:hypothetical protein
MQNDQQKCSLVGLQWYGLDLDRAAGSLGLSLQVIIMIQKRCNDRVPALLYALAQIGWAPAGLGRCSVQSANERLHTPSGVALTDVFLILTRTADASSEPLPLDWHNSNSIKDICACCQIGRFSGLCL